MILAVPVSIETLKISELSARASSTVVALKTVLRLTVPFAALKSDVPCVEPSLKETSTVPVDPAISLLLPSTRIALK
ncbi:hypothetical protein R50073_32180 [Maricurvus nonylphenolicus]